MPLISMKLFLYKKYYCKESVFIQSLWEFYELTIWTNLLLIEIKKSFWLIFQLVLRENLNKKALIYNKYALLILMSWIWINLNYQII